ncbi:MAG TPA: cytochrome b/b6 domain-containing protein [Bacteroidales bacterium]|nr:cytochrome b/b6 domain-containing protein [Bacteroidales bacterium]HSA43930.1 cytochrome b/b6 domain-containing protein [Bacteroidales bacterium]
MEMKKIYFYPVWLRLWHLVNAIMFLILIFTGFSIQYATASSSWIRFDIAIAIHDIAGIILTINYLVFIFGNQVTENGKYYWLTKDGGWSRLKKQLHFYTFGIFNNQPHPFPLNEHRKFNPLQKLTYILAMYLLLPILIITGLALYFPQIFDYIGLQSLVIADMIHIAIGYFLSIFMVIHIYFCTVGHTMTSNFKSMLNGWHEVHDHPEDHP